MCVTGLTANPGQVPPVLGPYFLPVKNRTVSALEYVTQGDIQTTGPLPVQAVNKRWFQGSGELTRREQTVEVRGHFAGIGSFTVLVPGIQFRPSGLTSAITHCTTVLLVQF